MTISYNEFLHACTVKRSLAQAGRMITQRSAAVCVCLCVCVLCVCCVFVCVLRVCVVCVCFVCVLCMLYVCLCVLCVCVGGTRSCDENFGPPLPNYRATVRTA